MQYIFSIRANFTLKSCYTQLYLFRFDLKHYQKSYGLTVMFQCRMNMLHVLCCRFWDHEVRKATKELRKPELSRVLIKCFGKSYAVAGSFVFLVVCSGYLKPPLHFVRFIHCGLLYVCFLCFLYHSNSILCRSLS